MIHIKQQEELGLFKFMVIYAAEFMRNFLFKKRTMFN